MLVSEQYDHVYPVIMAGGKGTRFWPLSRARKAKQFLTILGDETLLEMTIQRCLSLSSIENIMVVGSQKQSRYLKMVQEQHLGMSVLKEPLGKNTLPCIGWAAVELLKKDSDAIMVVVPADQWVSCTDAFSQTIAKAVDHVKNYSSSLLTIGIPPTSAHTGYGYIKLRNPKAELSDVEKFTEKPAQSVAESYLKEGAYLWNAGIFVFQAKQVLTLIKSYQPRMYQLLLQLAQEKEAAQLARRRVYEQFDSISIDYGLLEHVPSQIKCVPATFSWSDIGSWTALAPFLKQDNSKNATQASLVSWNASNNLVFSDQGSKKVIALANLHDLIVVDTKDALLILPKSSDQTIKALYDNLPESHQ